MSAAKRDEFDEMAERVLFDKMTLAGGIAGQLRELSGALRSAVREARDAGREDACVELSTMLFPVWLSNFEVADQLRARIARRAAEQPEATPLQPPLHGGLFYNPGETP